jgi:hypothetical protein
VQITSEAIPGLTKWTKLNQDVFTLTLGSRQIPPQALVVYVDDLIFWSCDVAKIDRVAMELCKLGVMLEQEDDAAGFLIVTMEHDSNTGLLEMKQTGLIEKVVEALGLDDADFAGKYGHEKPTDPTCAKSCSGFVIVFSGVPVLWQSKFQTQTALSSTMEAEVIALGACMKELIAIMNMVQSLAVAIGIPAGDVNVRVSVHEDNLGALVLTETLPPQFTPRSKYYATKTIWFCEEINRRGIKLLKIETSEQLGDMFTKGLAKPTFKYI